MLCLAICAEYYYCSCWCCGGILVPKANFIPLDVHFRSVGQLGYHLLNQVARDHSWLFHHLMILWTLHRGDYLWCQETICDAKNSEWGKMLSKSPIHSQMLTRYLHPPSPGLDFPVEILENFFGPQIQSSQILPDLTTNKDISLSSDLICNGEMGFRSTFEYQPHTNITKVWNLDTVKQVNSRISNMQSKRVTNKVVL